MLAHEQDAIGAIRLYIYSIDPKYPQVNTFQNICAVLSRNFKVLSVKLLEARVNFCYTERRGNMPHIGQVVRRMRDAAGLSGNDVEKRTRGKLKQSWLASLETGGIANPPESKLQLLARVLDTSVTEIYRLAGRIEIPATGLFPDEDELVRIYRSASPSDREKIRYIMRAFADADAQVTANESDAEAEPDAESTERKGAAA